MKKAVKLRFIDLSIPIESVPSDPEDMIPQVEYIDHRGGLARTQATFGCRPEDLPLGLGWAVERVTLSTHSGTHLDAPYHYAPVSEGKKSKTIDQIPLDWCYGNGVCLDFRRKKDGELITVEDLEKALKKIGYRIKPRDIVLIMTGADKAWGKPEYLLTGAG
ncbi:MAG TPA: cyclase family protein, partial [Thermodesulfobacteriota bacterium]|nr:cyclase family protein [Thermodesulfobacteriota bacterium]